MASHRILPLFLAGFLIFGFSYHADANPNVTTQTGGSSTQANNSDSSISDAVCDPDIFSRMRQKAWMEAQRENYTNQSIIKQPDSIFAATCFDKQIQNAKSNLGVAEGTGSSANTNNFQQNVQNTSGQIAGSFMAPYSGTGSQNSGGSSGSGFNCDAMKKIWESSSCENFAGSSLASLADVGRSGTDARGSCQNSAGQDSSGSAGASQYNYNTILGDMAKPGAGVSNFDAVKNERCKSIAYSELEANGCEKKCTPTYTGQVVQGKNEVSCQNGCKAQPGSGNNMECVPAN